MNELPELVVVGDVILGHDHRGAPRSLGPEGRGNDNVAKNSCCHRISTIVKWNSTVFFRRLFTDTMTFDQVYDTFHQGCKKRFSILENSTLRKSRESRLILQVDKPGQNYQLTSSALSSRSREYTVGYSCDFGSD